MTEDDDLHARLKAAIDAVLAEETGLPENQRERTAHAAASQAENLVLYFGDGP